MAYLIIAVGDKQKRFEIKEDFFFIGKSQGNQIRLNNPDVADQHCQIIKAESGYRLLDLGSATGTLLNGARVEKQADLKDGDLIQVGKFKMTLKGAEAADTAAASSDAPVVKQPASGGAARSRKGRARPGARRSSLRDEKAPLKIKKEFAAASERGGDRLVRRQLRKGSKIPVWAQLVIAFWVAVIVVMVGFFIVKEARPSKWHGHYLKAQQYITANQPHLAMQLLDDIPADDYHYGEMAVKELKRLQRQQEGFDVQRNKKMAMEYFANNIELFLQKYIDAPGDKPKMARKIKLEYAPDRKCYIRVLIICRIDYFLDKFKDAKERDQVVKLRKKYVKEVDLDAQPTYRDVEVESLTELDLKHFGNAYQAVAGYLENYPDTTFKGRIEDQIEVIRKNVQIEWAFRQDGVNRKVGKGTEVAYLGAVRDLERMLRLCEGYDAPEGKQWRASWQNKLDEINAMIDAMAGVDRRTQAE